MFNNNESQMSSYGFGHQSRLSMHTPIDQPQFSFKTIFDPIHGHITFSKIMWDIIDTPQFQRLRNLRQLSTSHFIYPGNNHSRFEHCLGTGFLSKDLINRCFDLLPNNNIDIDKTEIEYLKECVSIAGLCHDIGHGPFSHSFEVILEHLNIKNWDHEKFGGEIIQYLIDKNNIEGIDKDKLKLINSLIEGNNLHKTEYNWIYQIVANKENSIDVDKFDYIQRDIYHSGVKTLSVDYNRIFKDINIIDNNICFSDKNDLGLFNLFQARYCLHHKIYQHPQTICVETMVKDALLLSKDYFKFEEAILSPEKFVKLDDNILDIILNFSINGEEDKKLLDAEKIIRKVYERDFYSIIGEIPIPIGKNEEPKLEEFLCNDNPKDEFYLSENDIELRRKNINFGFKNKNPFETIYFYNRNNPNNSFKKPMEHLLIMPQVFSESTIIVFCKDKKKNERAKKLFDIYKKNLEKKWSVLESPESKKVEVDFGKKFFYDETEEKNLKTPKFNTSLLKKRERSDKIENFDYTNEN
jgi:HD superfamily phosphohydrolase